MGTRVRIVAGVTDLRRGFTGLSALVQMTLGRFPLTHRASNLLKTEGYETHAEEVANTEARLMFNFRNLRGDACHRSHARELSSYLGPDYLHSLKEKTLTSKQRPMPAPWAFVLWLFNLVSWKGACFTCEVFF
jgi:hypothetical protein